MPSHRLAGPRELPRFALLASRPVCQNSILALLCLQGVQITVYWQITECCIWHYICTQHCSAGFKVSRLFELRNEDAMICSSGILWTWTRLGDQVHTCTYLYIPVQGCTSQYRTSLFGTGRYNLQADISQYKISWFGTGGLVQEGRINTTTCGS